MRLLPLLALLLTAGCSDSQPDSDTVGKEIADDYQDVLDEAAEVELQLQNSKDKIDAALQDAEDDSGG